MRQHRTVILPSFATIFLCSLLLAASFTAFGAVMRVLSMEKNLYAVEAFLPEMVGEDSLKVIGNRLRHTKHIDSVSFVSADSALADFRRHFSGEMLDLVEGNPIPPFFRVTLDEENKNPSTLVEVKNALAREEIFEEIQAPVEWVEKIAAWKFRMIFWPICISVLLLFTLSLIICNSVRLSHIAKAFEQISARHSMSFGDEAKAIGELYYLMSALFAVPAVSLSEKVLRASLEYIDHHYSSPSLSVKSISEYCFVSESYLRKLFSDKLARSPFKYITDVRMQKAQMLIYEKLESCSH